VIDAILKGKVPVKEDVVTSCVVGMLDKMPREYGLLAWLERARPRGAMHETLHFGPAAHAQVLYWPRTADHGEPDVFVMVEDGAVAHAIVLEAKYGAQKSDWDEIDPQDLRGDQLVRYWEALRLLDMPGVPKGLLARAEKTVVYVTEDSTPPVEELQESIDKSGGGIRLAWLSWCDAWDLAEPFMMSVEPATAWLLALLEHLGLMQFRGFRSASESAVTDPLWYFDRGGFYAVAKVGVEQELLWRYTCE
jgi:hypothetical protein